MYRPRSLLIIVLGLFASQVFGQNPANVQQTKFVAPSSGPSRDFAKLPPEHRDIFLSAQRAGTWLRLANRPDGRFVYGFLPALRTPMEGDSFVAQAGATQALIRSAKFFHEEAGLVTARQALLVLLEETEVHPKDARIRFPSRASSSADRLANAGALLSAIHELPEASEQLLAHAEQLANGIRVSQQPDGSLASLSQSESSASSETDFLSAGLALQGIIDGQGAKPASWRTDLVRKARIYYEANWRKNKSLPLVIGHAPAYAKAYLDTKDPSLADTVFVMNDWLVTLQYQNSSAMPSHWAGGFQSWIDGKAVGCAPDIQTARIAECLAEACRVAKLAGERERLQTYTQALHNALVFLTRLQYTETRASHFVESFRPAIVGGFHASHQDGNLRIDFTRHALSAMVQYLDRVVEWQ